MIEKIAPQSGAWNEDTTRIIEKLNEIVDILNGKNDKDQKNGKKTAPDIGKAKGKEEANVRQKGIEEDTNVKKAIERKGKATQAQRRYDPTG